MLEKGQNLLVSLIPPFHQIGPLGWFGTSPSRRVCPYVCCMLSPPGVIFSRPFIGSQITLSVQSLLLVNSPSLLPTPAYPPTSENWIFNRISFSFFVQKSQEFCPKPKLLRIVSLKNVFRGSTFCFMTKWFFRVFFI